MCFQAVPKRTTKRMKEISMTEEVKYCRYCGVTKRIHEFPPKCGKCMTCRVEDRMAGEEKREHERGERLRKLLEASTRIPQGAPGRGPDFERLVRRHRYGGQ